MAAPEATRLTFAYYVTGHGLGHATRVVEVARHLVAAGHEVHVVTGAPAYVFERDIASPALRVRQVLLDCGAVQSDALTVDRLASLEQYRRTAVVPRDSLLETEAAWLQSVGAHLVVSDVVPIACAAAARASVPAVCVSNFSWDFVYSEYVMEAGHEYEDIVWQIAEDYSKAALLIRLPGFCPMPAFRDIVDVPLVVREARRSRAEVRKHLGLAEGTKLLLYNFGGQDGDWSLQESFLPSDWNGVVCTTLPVGNLPPNFVKPDRDAYTPDLIAACDCMLGKIGYGTASEALAYKVPFIFIRRDFFNEEPFLRKLLEFYRCGVEMRRRDFFDGTWAPYLSRALTIKPCYNGPLDGGKVVAKFLEAAARGQVGSISLQSGNSRLKDAIIFGYKLHRYPGRINMEVPDWYTKEQYRHQDSSFPVGSVSVVEEQWSHGDFDILHGSTQGLSDTIEFLQMLATLDAAGNVQASDAAPIPQPNEVLAAGKFFCWEEDVYVTRAPGRLDVMGGIADYSGSLVLQMPIKEACHVALQRNALETQKLWKHTEARNDGSTKAALQIVSFGADQANRAPSFDMNLLEFLDETGDPITYATARKYFNQDPSRRWAAYIAGCVLVLMRERSVRFTDGINILVASRVPEGKGVSSSAAVEVATMSALSAAYDLRLLPRELAILCQKVENEVVGAPCGVMDQMASACGEANKLLAMVCQPAEVKEHVIIPSHVQFWGLDSGIRHSVGGADYGTVRAGAFMGRKIIKAEAQAHRDVASTTLARTASGLLAAGSEYVDEEQLEYLCNIPPHRYGALYSSLLPEQMEASDFLARYDDHGDSATTLLPTRQYPIRAATSHPINENFRVQLFASLLGAESAELQLQALGELMYQSHESYSRCGLGSDGTDRLVSLTHHSARSAQKPGLHGLGTSLFGAKITGGGCGGTVCILGRRDAGAQAEVEQIEQEYKLATGHLPHRFEGSSPGAGRFGFLRIRRRRTDQNPPQERET
eukprot:SM000122S25794  [mRNA]  locus=s122:376915:386453:+ [translate_table: standard]